MATVVEVLAGVDDTGTATLNESGDGCRRSNGAGKDTSCGAQDGNSGDDELGEEHGCRETIGLREELVIAEVVGTRAMV